MEYILTLFYRFRNHFLSNFTDYLLFLGISLILLFVYMSYGVPALILGLGLTLILLSIIITLNKKKEEFNKYRNRY